MRSRTLLVVAASSLLGPAVADARRTVTVRVPTFDVAPRKNREICTFVPLKANGPMDVDQVVIRNIGGRKDFASHHLLVYAYSGNLEPLAKYRGQVKDDTACLNFGSGNPTQLHLIATSQLPTLRQKTPRGTALHIEPRPFGSGQAIGLVLNSHWINGSDETRKARAIVKLTTARPATVKQTLKPIFEAVACGFIDLPPGQVATVGYKWGPQVPAFPFLGGATNPKGPACVTMLTGHMHHRGTLFTADLVRAGGTPERVYTNATYSEPPILDLRSKPILVNVGDSIDYACTHDNKTSPKLGCEEEPGVAPGLTPYDTFPHLDGAAKRCTTLGSDPAECPPTDAAYPKRTFTGNCVQAKLVFGFNSDDDMCILPGYYYDANPNAPAGQECDL